MIRIAVCDDNVVMCDQICKHIMDIFNTKQIECDISNYSKGVLLLQANDNENFDVLFLDIQMPDVDGFVIADEIKKRYPRIQIIFITANKDLVYKTFDYQPFYFICKGASEGLAADILKSINLLLERMKQYANIVLELPLSEKKLVPVRDVKYIESMGHYLSYSIVGMEPQKVRGSIEKAFLEMEQYDFIRIHRRFLINLSQIKIITQSNPDIKMSDGTILQAGGKYKDQVYDKYIKHMRTFDF